MLREKEILTLLKNVAIQHVDNVLQVTCPIKRASILYRFIAHTRERKSTIEIQNGISYNQKMIVVNMINEIVGHSKEELDYVKAN
tara:strand:- start:379 stop:633 length:255 start_codon:yes stop_codon:yes gene_type:complete